MALRSGYYGLKGSVKKSLEKLAGDVAGMKVIKSFGDGFNLTSAGKLNMTSASASKIGGVKVGEGLSIDNGVLSIEGSSGGSYLEQYNILDDPTESLLGKIIQYVGETNQYMYTKGFFYQCVSSDSPYRSIIPVMTSNTQPSGVASASSEHSPLAAWCAFRGQLIADTGWMGEGVAGQWLQYKFTAPVKIKRLRVYNFNSNSGRPYKQFTFQGSNDGVNYTDLATCNNTSSASSHLETFDINNDNDYLYYRLLITDGYDPSYVGIGYVDMQVYQGDYKWQKINVQ